MVVVIGTTFAFNICVLPPTGAVPTTTTPLFICNVFMQFFCNNVVIFVAATCAPFVCCEQFIKLTIVRATYKSTEMNTLEFFSSFFFYFLKGKKTAEETQIRNKKKRKEKLKKCRLKRDKV